MVSKMTPRLKANTLTNGHKTVRLTDREVTIIYLVMCHGKVSFDLISEVLWPDADTMPDYWRSIIQISVHRLRQKINGFGFKIVTKWSYGYGLEIDG